MSFCASALVARFRELGSAEPGASRPRDERLPPVWLSSRAGARRRVHKVDRARGGLPLRGRDPRQSSTIAKAITGVIWNGYVFFGRALKEARA